MLPMTKLERAKNAYIESYGKEKFGEELSQYVNSIEKSIEEIIKDEISINGVYDPIILHIRYVQSRGVQ